MAEETPQTTTTDQNAVVNSVIDEIIYSPVNVALVAIIIFLIYKIFKSSRQVPESPPEPELPPLKKDLTVEELKKYDGAQQDGRILVAVNGNIYDVTKGKRFYGQGGPYSIFAGRDASRGLATFSVSEAKDDYDDLSDLSPHEMDSVREWEEQFKEKYIFVGKLLRPGEQPNNYSDDEDESAAEKNKKD